MEGKRLIEKIRLRNILSFGDKGEEIELQPLNVLIGPNASGKSNLVDVIKLLRELTRDKGLSNLINKSGGIGEWIWKGKSHSAETYAQIEIKSYDIIYEINFKGNNFFGVEVINEIVIDSETKKSLNRDQLLSDNELPEKINSSDSILQRKGRLPMRNVLEEKTQHNIIFFEVDLKRIKIYSDLQTSRNSKIRGPQIPGEDTDFLEEDASNLSLVLNDLEHRGNTKDIIVEHLKKFNPRIKSYSVRIQGGTGTVQLFIREEDLETPISAMRLSDGTLRYLCLLAILCHPEPPPLVCIEEPETGLHPDILPTIGELLIEASKRTQLIVTTHSDILVSSFSEVPEAVLVCEADEDGTHLKRLERDKLKGWLEEYQLGDLWIRGEIGGKRW